MHLSRLWHSFWLVVLLIGLPETWLIYFLFHSEVPGVKREQSACFMTFCSLGGTSCAAGCGPCAGFQGCAGLHAAPCTAWAKGRCTAHQPFVEVYLSGSSMRSEGLQGSACSEVVVSFRARGVGVVLRPDLSLNHVQ